jgi:hypothetical protein
VLIDHKNVEELHQVRWFLDPKWIYLLIAERFLGMKITLISSERVKNGSWITDFWFPAECTVERNLPANISAIRLFWISFWNITNF